MSGLSASQLGKRYLVPLGALLAGFLLGRAASGKGAPGDAAEGAQGGAPTTAGAPRAAAADTDQRQQEDDAESEDRTKFALRGLQREDCDKESEMRETAAGATTVEQAATRQEAHEDTAEARST